MTLSEGEKSLSASLDAFQPPWRATQRVLGDRGGDGEKVEGQRSTAAKRQTRWPKCRLHSSTSGRVRAVGPDRRRGPSTCSIEQPKTTREKRSPDGLKLGVRGGAGRQRDGA